MKVRKALNDLLRVLADESERNPDFGNRVAMALGLAEKPKKSERQDTGTSHKTKSRSPRPKNRRPPPVLDPVEIARSGEKALRERLGSLSLEELRDIVADFGMDPGKLVIKWKTAERIIGRIVEISIARAHKGDAFRIDLEHTHMRLMAALKGLSEGKGLDDFVVVPPYGQQTKIASALNDAARHLIEPFHADDMEIVDAAFNKIGLSRTSTKKNEVAAAIIRALRR